MNAKAGPGADVTTALSPGPAVAPPHGTGTLDVSLTFHFDAAHHFHSAPDGHRYGRLHGHSFEATVHVSGTPDPVMGFVVDFDLLRQATGDIREKLDHRLLNEIEGLEAPSLERIAIWVFNTLKPKFSGLNMVEIRRPSIGEACRYRG